MDGADGVYPSSEDSFLLIDAVHKDIQFIKYNVSIFPLCIEIGCGSGEVTLALISMFPDTVIFSTDVNPLAVGKTRSLLQNKTPMNRADVIRADLFQAFTPTTAFDIILFNPPYVPTDDDELSRALNTQDISASWAGGSSGRYVIDKFLDSLPDFLAHRAIAYLVLLEENDPDQITRILDRKGLSASIILKRKTGIESLYVMRVTSFISNE